MSHTIWIRQGAGGYQAVCTCGEYASRWRPTEGRAGQCGRAHTNGQLKAAAAREAREQREQS